VINGRVLDTSALVAFARRESVYADALVWTAVEETIVLVIPSTAMAAALTQLDPKYHPVLEVLLNLPVTVVDPLDARRARTLGQLGGPQPDAHAAACAQERGWPVVTGDADRYAEFGDRVEIEVLP
jgi:predicted nucleic acid-binding protein